MKLIYFLIILFLCSHFLSVGQLDRSKKPLIDPTVRKSGPYFGIQQGKYTLAELGGEMIFKNIKIRKPKTNAFHVGGDYNLTQNVLGFSAGYWLKRGRFNFTYGADLVYRTNFDEHRVGIAPVLGYRIFGFHVRAGYNFLTPSTAFSQINGLFIGLRFTLINQRDFELNKRKSGAR
ncbi:MAG: hypothetical protein R3277_00815 [Brumimicrobium sp.]|nr:hypothetical protein [Brumimicrobium sp.]